MTKQELAYWIAFNHLQVGPVNFAKLLDYFGSAEKSWKAKFKKLQKVNLKLAQKIIQQRAQFDPEKLLEGILRQEIKILTIKDQSYPVNLSQIDSAPYLLYLKGEILPADIKAISVVGSRKITSYGQQVTENLVNGLVMAGLTIISGLARGVDSLAHKTAIGAGGRTIAVLGCGVDVCYPAENKKLYQEIISNGAVISEFPPGTAPKPENFPTRNRIIAGLALAVLVTEAGKISGSLITAGYAADFGREVFAVPGPIYSQMSAGTANLIKDGAKLVYSLSDILEELNINSFYLEQKTKPKPANQIEEKIFQILQKQPASIDEIVKQLNLPTSQILASLSLMEIKGVVKKLTGGVYGLKS